MSAPSLRRGILFGAVVALTITILGYGIFESRRLLSGPRITIESPKSGSATSSALVTISGTAKNISFLTMNGAPAYADETGRFFATLSPSPGYAIFTVSASDRFGRRATSQVHITVLNYCFI